MLGVVFAGCQTVEKSYNKMSSLQIRKTLPGNTLKGSDSSGSYEIYYDSESTFKAIYDGKKDTGSWQAVDGMYCRSWDNLGTGSERCFIFLRDKDEIIWTDSSGKKTDTSRLLIGNPSGL
jgi:hypothetical protein